MKLNKEKDIKAVKKLINQFRRGMIGNKKAWRCCYVVCLPLQSYLRISEGIETELIEGVVYYYRIPIAHYWLRLKNGEIIDPTAEQFATKKRPMPKVYIGKKPRWYKNETK